MRASQHGGQAAGERREPRYVQVVQACLLDDGVICWLRWRSSLWKLLWQELLAYTGGFLVISMVYRYCLKEEQQMEVEKLIRWCRQQSTGEGRILWSRNK